MNKKEKFHPNPNYPLYRDPSSGERRTSNVKKRAIQFAAGAAIVGAVFGAGKGLEAMGVDSETDAIVTHAENEPYVEEMKAQEGIYPPVTVQPEAGPHSPAEE